MLTICPYALHGYEPEELYLMQLIVAEGKGQAVQIPLKKFMRWMSYKKDDQVRARLQRLAGYGAVVITPMRDANGKTAANKYEVKERGIKWQPVKV